MSRQEPGPQSLYQAVQVSQTSQVLSERAAVALGIPVGGPHYQPIHAESFSPTKIPILKATGTLLRTEVARVGATNSSDVQMLNAAFADVSEGPVRDAVRRLMEGIDRATLPGFTTNVLHDDPADLILDLTQRQDVAAARAYYPRALDFLLQAGAQLSPIFGPKPDDIRQKVAAAGHVPNGASDEEIGRIKLREQQVAVAGDIVRIYRLLPELQAGRRQEIRELRAAFIRLTGGLRSLEITERIMLGGQRRPTSAFSELTLVVDGQVVRFPRIAGEVLAADPGNLARIGQRIRK